MSDKENETETAVPYERICAERAAWRASEALRDAAPDLADALAWLVEECTDGRGDGTVSAIGAARAALRKAGIALALACTFVLPLGAAVAEPPSQADQAAPGGHRQADAAESRFYGDPRPFYVRTADADSCTAWVDVAGVARDKALGDAFRACLAAVKAAGGAK